MTMNNLFNTNSNVSTNSNRGLLGTAQLTQLANSIVESIIDQINNDTDAYLEQLKASQTDHDAMDKLIQQFDDLTEADADFLQDLSNDHLDQMLKSQQSKRSRCKSKQMTLDNYKAMMSAACAEYLLRQKMGKQKHAGGYNRGGATVDYTIEQLEALAADQSRLRAEIRNIQSKKSIMKAKADFDESSDRWQSLLRAEQTLKDLRESKQRVVKVDETKQQVRELIGDVDLNNLNADDSKALLAKLAAMLGEPEATDEAE